jgi:hypothetical protein
LPVLRERAQLDLSGLQGIVLLHPKEVVLMALPTREFVQTPRTTSGEDLEKLRKLHKCIACLFV